MIKRSINPKIDAFLSEAGPWREAMTKLRKIMLDCGLTEELKWGKPCYSFEENNVVIIQGFKEYCAVLFCKGALLKDPKKILIRQTENVQAARQVRFTQAREVIKLESVLKAYVREAVEAEKAGLKVNYKKTSDFKVPEEFISKLDEVSNLKAAFDALTPGRQRGYLLYFSAPKQSKTRESRIEKCLPLIFKGKGLNDD